MHVFCQTCKTDVEPGVDRNTLKDKQAVSDTKAICPGCKTPLPITTFMIQTLVRLGQFYTAPISKAAFAFKCTPCDKILPAILSSDKTKALCTECNKPFDVTPMMIRAMAVAKNNSLDPQGGS